MLLGFLTVEIAEVLRLKFMAGLDEEQRNAIDFLVEQVVDVLTHKQPYDDQFYSTYLYDHVLHPEILLKKVDWSSVCELVEKNQAKKLQLVNRICAAIQVGGCPNYSHLIVRD
jgi:hypothetical protein